MNYPTVGATLQFSTTHYITLLMPRADNGKEDNLSILSRIFWQGTLLLIFLFPLVFSISLYRSFDTAKSSLLRVGVSLLLLLWSFLMWKNPSAKLWHSSPVTRAASLSLSAYLAGTVLSIEPVLSLFGTYDRQVGLIGVAAVTGLYLLLVDAFRRGESKKSVIKAMSLAASLAAVYGLIQYVSLDPIEWTRAFGNRPTSTLGHPDFLGSLLVMTLPLTLSLLYDESRYRRRVLWLVSVLLQTIGIVVSQTRGAWIAAALSLTALLISEPFLHRKIAQVFRQRIRASLITLVFLAVCSAFFLWSSPVYRLRALSIFHLESQPRIYLWRDALKVVTEYPVLGSGPETFRLSFMPHKSLALAKMEPQVNYDNPHNNYLYVWATTGTAGLLAYLYLIFCAMREGVRRLSEENTSVSPTVYLGVLSSLAAYCVAMVTGFDTLPTLFYLYVLTALLFGEEGDCPKAEAPALPLMRGKIRARVFLVLILFPVHAFMLMDSALVIKADHLALKAMKGTAPPFPDGTGARDLLLRACELLPRESFYPLNLGRTYISLWQEGKRDKRYLAEAIRWGKASLIHGWAPENSYSLMSTAYFYAGDYHAGEMASRRGLESDPYNFPLRTNLALSLAGQGKRKAALVEAEQALRINPEYPPAKNLHSMLLESRGQSIAQDMPFGRLRTGLRFDELTERW